MQSELALIDLFNGSEGSGSGLYFDLELKREAPRRESKAIGLEIAAPCEVNGAGFTKWALSYEVQSLASDEELAPLIAFLLFVLKSRTV